MGGNLSSLYFLELNRISKQILEVYNQSFKTFQNNIIPIESITIFYMFHKMFVILFIYYM